MSTLLTTLLGTLLIVGLSCLAMALGQLVHGRPLQGGCGNRPTGISRCIDCPKRRAREAAEQGDSP